MSRRQLLATAVLLAATSPLACRLERLEGGLPEEFVRPGQGGAGDGRLAARPAAPPPGEAAVGLQPLELTPDRDGLLYVPAGYRPERPLALVVTLHGAGGDALGGLGPLRDRADEAGMLLLAPASRGRTWDALLGGFGPDVAFLDRALDQTLSRYAVDPERTTIAGFSDGASYALGLGLANGDRFRRIIAFSPGFVPRAPRHGQPRVFVSHGQADDVLPIDRCSRRIVPNLRGLGHDVQYREFEGGHAIPPEVVDEALAWWQKPG